MKRLAVLLSAVLIIMNTSVLAANESNKAETEVQTSVEYDAYELISGYIADMYIDDSYTTDDIMKIGLSEYLKANGDEALVGLLKSALHSLDNYSDFYTREEYLEYTNSLNKTFYGLGVNLHQAGEYVEIQGFVEENSLAEKSGFRVRDKIIKVDGIDVVGNSINEVRNLVVGELGTTVVLTVLRNGEMLDITGTRTAVNNSTVSGGVLKDDIGYMKIASFSSGTADEFKEISGVLKEQGVKRLILDLRNNPGGHVSAAVDIANALVPEGKIIDVKYRDEKLNHSFYSTLKETPFELVTLVNGSTASSAEILASAIQDSGAGILMGEQTYGKAVIQSSYSLNNGMVMKLTIGQYITRNGNEIGHIGLEPDIAVKNSTERIDTSSYTKFDFLTPVSVGANGQNVTAAKERLYVMNYFIGNMSNNVFNTDLKEAVKAFQRDNGLTDSGILDIPTQVRLKEVFEKLETVIDIQLDRAYEYFGGNAEDLHK